MGWKGIALGVAAGVVIAGAAGFVIQKVNCPAASCGGVQKAGIVAKKGAVYGQGQVRGNFVVALSNKYSGFIQKVNFFTQDRVKKGDVILEYDDYELRVKIDQMNHAIADQERAVELAKQNLQLVSLDPLPSSYKNLHWKQRMAEERYKRHAHEAEVYKKLYGNKIVSDLSVREKVQTVQDHRTELEGINSDMNVLNKGLANLYIQQAKTSLEKAELQLKNLKDELALLKEDQKYYKIVSPIDGISITYSDTVAEYNSAGTNAATIHQDKSKTIYAFFAESDISYVKENAKYQFISNQYGSDVAFEVEVYEVDPIRRVYGEQTFFRVKCRVTAEPQPLRIESLGTVVVPVK